MALDQADRRLFVITRYSARLLVFDTTTGKTVQLLPAVVDCDDVFYDKARKRIYAIGGEAAISVFEQLDPDHYRESARIITVKGARTGFFSSELDRLFLAVRRQGTLPAAIRVFIPVRWTLATGVTPGERYRATVAPSTVDLAAVASSSSVRKRPSSSCARRTRVRSGDSHHKIVGKLV
jgi:hypothetical protein